MGARAKGGDRGFHIEWFFGERLGEPILVRCWCGIGHDHSYGDWVARYQAEADADAELGLTTFRPVVQREAHHVPPSPDGLTAP